MLGHPGISAYEFAGAVERHNHEEKAWERATEQTSLRYATRRGSTPSAKLKSENDGQSVARTSDPPLLQTPVDEYTTTQRRRGTFMNHTPRNHEVRLSTKLSHRPTSSEDLGRFYAAYRGSSDENSNNEVSFSAQHSSYGSFGVNQSGKVNTNTPVEPDSKKIFLNPLIMHPLPTVPTCPAVLPRQRRSQSSSAAASIRSSQTGLSKRSLRAFLSRNASLDASFHHQPASAQEPRPSTPPRKSKLRPETANSKRRRRQTPYSIPKPLVIDQGRHAPLEPLVLRHRREVTGSDVDPLPPHVDIDNDISEAATLMAINEYFDNQEGALSTHSSVELTCPGPSSSELPSDVVDLETSPRLSFKDGAPRLDNSEEPKESTPSLPERNPERLSRVNTPLTPRRTKSSSELSVQSDFMSAAKGKYSPYDECFDTLPKMLHRVPVPLPQSPHAPIQGRSASSASGKLAPRIPAHDELANTRLNDFNYFLRMTGPSPTNEAKTPPKKKRNGLRVIKVRNRKESPHTARKSSSSEQQACIPACVERCETSKGAKHLQIKIPGPVLDVEPASTQPNDISALDANAQNRERLSVVWTEEMLHPLGSYDVERAINTVDAPSPAPKSPLRSPKPAAVSPRAVPVEHHPLLVSRKDQTRSRKLRDLKKVKEKIDGADERVKSLEWLVGELAEGLACAAGIDARLSPEEVLEAWRGLETRDG